MKDTIYKALLEAANGYASYFDDSQKNDVRQSFMDGGRAAHLITMKYSELEKQELVTRLYNLVNAVNNLTGSFDASTTPAVDFALTEARETLSKIIK